MLGIFDGRGGVLEKTGYEVACEVAGWAVLGLVLGNCPGSVHRKKCSRCSCQEVLRIENPIISSRNHRVQAIVVSMGQPKKSVVNTKAKI